MRNLSIDDRVDRSAAYQLRKGSELLDCMSTDLRRYLAGNQTDLKPKYPLPRTEPRSLSSEGWHHHKFRWRPEPEVTRAGWPFISFNGRSEERQESRLRNYIDTKYWTNPYVHAIRATTVHHTEVAPNIFDESNHERIRKILRHREMDASRTLKSRRPKQSIDKSFVKDLNQTFHSILNTSTSVNSRSKSGMRKSSLSKGSRGLKKSVNFMDNTLSKGNKALTPKKREKVATTKLLNSIRKLTRIISDKDKKAWH